MHLISPDYNDRVILVDEVVFFQDCIVHQTRKYCKTTYNTYFGIGVTLHLSLNLAEKLGLN